jgi:hypothetical protein
LEERTASGAAREALEEARTAVGGYCEQIGDFEVVLDELELGCANLREDDLVGVRDRDASPGGFYGELFARSIICVATHLVVIPSSS